jgi:hypothetical protein
VADRFVGFVKSYAEHFKSYRRDVSEKARQYASGLMQAGSRKNIYAISEVVPETDNRNLQQFITHSKWSAREVLDHVARDADELIGDGSDAALILDESGFAKQGKMSVGASRQYLGRLGKVDNGQVAVFGVLAKGRFATAIDTRLYLPKEWTDDAERCDKAGIPQSERVFKTKNQLALEIVEQARRNGVRFGWVGADAGYGSGPDHYVVKLRATSMGLFLHDRDKRVPGQDLHQALRPHAGFAGGEALSRRSVFPSFLAKSEEKNGWRGLPIYVNGLRCLDYWRRSCREGCGVSGGSSWLRSPVDRKRKAGRHFLSQRLLHDSGLADLCPVLLFAWNVGVQYLGAFRQSLWDADLLKAGNELRRRWWPAGTFFAIWFWTSVTLRGSAFTSARSMLSSSQPIRCWNAREPTVSGCTFHRRSASI